MFLCTALAWLARGAAKELGVQLSLRNADIDGVVSIDDSAGDGIAASSSFKTVEGRAITAGNSPPRATRANSTSIICLMGPALPLRCA
jgi:ABC-type xylose transport system substrate-binding protein